MVTQNNNQLFYLLVCHTAGPITNKQLNKPPGNQPTKKQTKLPASQLNNDNPRQMASVAVDADKTNQAKAKPANQPTNTHKKNNKQTNKQKSIPKAQLEKLHSQCNFSGWVCVAS